MCVPLLFLFSLMYIAHQFNIYIQLTPSSPHTGTHNFNVWRIDVWYTTCVWLKTNLNMSIKKINSLNVCFFANPYSARNSGLCTHTRTHNIFFLFILEKCICFMSVSPHWHINAANRFF